MEEVILKTTLDDTCSLYISPIDRQTYEEHVADKDIGGSGGYFVMLSRKVGAPNLEVLAKAATLEAAVALFDLIVASRERGDDRRRANQSMTPIFL